MTSTDILTRGISITIRNRGLPSESRQCIYCKNYTKFLISANGEKQKWSELCNPTDAPVCHIHAKHHYHPIQPPKPKISPTLECSVCMTAECNSITICGHAFHMKCLYKWFRQKYECPNCRYHQPAIFKSTDQRKQGIEERLAFHHEELETCERMMESVQQHHIALQTRIQTHHNWLRE